MFLPLFLIFLNMSILFCNVSGIGNDGSFRHLKYLIKHHEIKMVGLDEPKISRDNAKRTC